MKQLPDTSEWLPRDDKQIALRNTLLQTCRRLEARIISESATERKFNIDNYDSGSGIEDIVREQFQILLPSRYSLAPGVIIDRNGTTCGECDIAIVNRAWVPLLKYGATDDSRRIHIPVESVYSIVEVKQTLNEDALDDAMEKIVTYKRLERARSEYGRIIENHNLKPFENTSKSLNYRFDAILGVGCKDGEFDELVKRFFLINKTLTPSERVNALTILGSGYACYVTKENGGFTEYLYPESQDKESFPYYLPTSRDSLYYLWVNLWQHLSLTVLNFERFKHRYGFDDADKSGQLVSLEK